MFVTCVKRRSCFNVLNKGCASNCEVFFWANFKSCYK